MSLYEDSLTIQPQRLSNVKNLEFRKFKMADWTDLRYDTIEEFNVELSVFS